MPPKPKSRSRSRSRSKSRSKSKSGCTCGTCPACKKRKSECKGGKSKHHLAHGHDYWLVSGGDHDRYDHQGGALDGPFKMKKEMYDAICAGKKTVDARLNYGIFKDFKVGDVITIQSSDSSTDTCEIKIKSIEKYDSFSAAIGASNYKKIVPGAGSKEEVIELLESIPRFNKKQKEYGVLLIEFKKQ